MGMMRHNRTVNRGNICRLASGPNIPELLLKELVKSSHSGLSPKAFGAVFVTHLEKKDSGQAGMTGSRH